MEKKHKGVPPVTPKSKGKQSLDKGERANTPGNPYDRSQSQYSKAPPQTDSSPLLGGDY